MPKAPWHSFGPYLSRPHSKGPVACPESKAKPWPKTRRPPHPPPFKGTLTKSYERFSLTTILRCLTIALPKTRKNLFKVLFVCAFRSKGKVGPLSCFGLPYVQYLTVFGGVKRVFCTQQNKTKAKQHVFGRQPLPISS